MKVDVLFKTNVYWINLSPLQERTVAVNREISVVSSYSCICFVKKVLSIDHNTLFVCLGLLRSGT